MVLGGESGETPGSYSDWLNRNRHWGYSQSCCATFPSNREGKKERERLGVRTVVRRLFHDCLPETWLFISKLNKKGRGKAILEQTIASKQTPTMSTHTEKLHFSQKLLVSPPPTNHFIFKQARNSLHWINLSFPTSTALPEYPSTSHPLSPPLPNRKGDNERHHTPPSSLTGRYCAASVPSMGKVMPHLYSEDLYFTLISLCELKLLSCHFTPARAAKQLVIPLSPFTRQINGKQRAL